MNEQTGQKTIPRWKQLITKIINQATPARIAIIILLLGLLVIVTGFMYLYPPGQRTIKQFVTDLYANGGAELLSIAVTVLVIDGLNQRRATREQKEALILQMGSPDRGFAIEATRILASKGWLEDGSLTGADLCGANLSGASLGGADLRDADLRGADLRDADLSGASLSGADLSATLPGVLSGANLTGAGLRYADLRGADLSGANLTGADLRYANLYSVGDTDAKFGGGTTLPDGSRWTKDTNMGRFTDEILFQPFFNRDNYEQYEDQSDEYKVKEQDSDD
jgi:hypothetical protein